MSLSLSRVLLSIPMERAGFALIDLAPSAGLRLPPIIDRSVLHYVLGGELYVDHPDAPRTRLGAGDFVCLPWGAGHEILGTDAAAGEVTFCLQHLKPTEAPVPMAFGSGAAGCTLLSSCIDISHTAGQNATATLPDVIVLRAGTERTGSFPPPAMFGAALSGIGGSAFAACIIHALFAQAIRASLSDSLIVEQPQLRTLRYPKVASLHRMIERHFAEPWTLDNLAEAAGMARSTFAAAFTHATGEPPLARLTRIRMRHAHGMLAGNRSVEAIAKAVGYTSPAAFTRAYRRQFGETPRDSRARWRTEDAAPTSDAAVLTPAAAGTTTPP